MPFYLFAWAGRIRVIDRRRAFRMPIDESRYRMREKARQTGSRVKAMLDNYVNVRRSGEDILRKTEVLWWRVAIAAVVLVGLVTLIVVVVRR